MTNKQDMIFKMCLKAGMKITQGSNWLIDEKNECVSFKEFWYRDEVIEKVYDYITSLLKNKEK